MIASLVQSLKGDRLLHFLLAIACILSFFIPFIPQRWFAAIDWHTIITLSGLLLLTKGIELSGYFDALGRKMAQRFATERQLAVFMVLTASLLATFLTNDVALFIVIPLTQTLKKWCAIPINRLIIFEALAVNSGSLLTPIGNPQNILLWGRSGLSFLAFSEQMLPLAITIILTLLLLCGCCFSATPLRFQQDTKCLASQPRLIAVCLVLYLIFLTMLEMKQGLWGLLLLAGGFLLLARAVFLRVDWSLLLVFMAMFVDVHMLTQLPLFYPLLERIGHFSAIKLWLTAIGMSQFISNVPATILLLHAVPPSPSLAWAVNIGGFGLFSGSLANLIALRMAADRHIWWRFHLYSLPLLLWAAVSGYLLLQYCG
ncbi:SLC13 family permease [Enterobacteriaceae bacterium ESL0689]|nr:SLC13 family permease [Enterobacteriaceae bacterium ESL0689]